MSDTGNVPRRNVSFCPGRCPILVRQTIVQGRTPVPGYGRGQGRKMAAGAPGSRGNAGEPARLFLALGLTVFGGSAALRHSSSNP
jgi:hypothetical protein